MDKEFDEYVFLIGKLTIAAAHLEEVVIRWTALFSDGDIQETHKKQLLVGLDKNLSLLKERVGQKCSPGQLQLLDSLVEKARVLKNKRNENVHGVWYKMVDAHTGVFAKVQRERYEKVKATKVLPDGQLIWHLDTPTKEELKNLAIELDEMTKALEALLDGIWSTDEPVLRWKAANNYY
jgi:hypothetical protein